MLLGVKALFTPPAWDITSNTMTNNSLSQTFYNPAKDHITKKRPTATNVDASSTSSATTSTKIPRTAKPATNSKNATTNEDPTRDARTTETDNIDSTGATRGSGCDAKQTEK